MNPEIIMLNEISQAEKVMNEFMHVWDLNIQQKIKSEVMGTQGLGMGMRNEAQLANMEVIGKIISNIPLCKKVCR